MENYPQNNMKWNTQNNMQSDMQGNVQNYANNQPVKKIDSKVIVLIAIEHILMIIGIAIAYFSVPDVKIPISVWGSKQDISLRGSIVEAIMQSVNAITFFLVNPIIFTGICSEKLKRIGATSGVKIATIIITLLPTICVLITICVPFVRSISMYR